MSLRATIARIGLNAIDLAVAAWWLAVLAARIPLDAARAAVRDRRHRWRRLP